LHPCLIAALSYTDLGFWVAVLEVCVVLGLVIFVHELGHFSVAKMCGVRVDKFYLGFDIGGWKICKFRWGETEYGIGVLPLGGYVKMLGQEDNPQRLREEIERAKAEPGADAAALATAQQALYDPRSYLAKSVPQRMAIISAGVIMNLVFAVITAAAAYGLFGVRQLTSTVGNVIPGDGAWQAGLRIGDRIEQINGQPVTVFDDVLKKIVLRELNSSVPIEVRRPGVKELLAFQVKTLDMGGRPGIGVAPAVEPQLMHEKDISIALAASSAADAKPAFAPGDRFVAIDGRPVHNYTDVNEAMLTAADRPLRIKVQRNNAKQDLEITVAAQPVKWLGVAMEMGPVTAIQTGSAADGKLEVGDVIRTIDGAPAGDPLSLPYRLTRGTPHEVEFGVQRGKDKQLVKVRLRRGGDALWNPPRNENNPLPLPGFGVCYRVLNRVAAVTPGTPAAKAGLQPGDLIQAATILPPDKDQIAELAKKYNDPSLKQDEDTLQFDQQRHNWPLLSLVLQNALPGTTVKLTWARDDKPHDATLALVAAADWFSSDRGFRFQPELIRQKAGSFGEALAMGSRETLNSATFIFGMLKRVGRGVSARNFGGPVSIFNMAMGAAEEGLGALLMFATLLGANLAVINFLPIPVLDGGHMVFLVWEGIRGKPADERVQIALAYAGLLLIITLMIFVFGLDLHLISRPGPGH
jgi:regulator of sigma E protease